MSAACVSSWSLMDPAHVSQVPSAPASRLALLEQHGLPLEHKLHRSAVSYKLLAALQSLCLPDADLLLHAGVIAIEPDVHAVAMPNGTSAAPNGLDEHARRSAAPRRTASAVTKVIRL